MRQQKNAKNLNGSLHSTTSNGTRTSKRVIGGKGPNEGQGAKTKDRSVKKSKPSSSFLMSWILSLALSFTLFQTFTYEPPSQLDALSDAHHPLKMIQQSEVSKKQLLQTLQVKTKEQTAKAVDLKAEVGKALAVTEKDPVASKNQREIISSEPKHENNSSRTILQVLQEAGVAETLTPEERSMLPNLQRIWNELYGSTELPTFTAGEPVIYGMETCEAYRQMVPRQDRYTAPAGMFNTGTNNLELNMQKNLEGIRALYQVPWGKHRMEARRLKHTAPGADRFNQSNCLPVVIVRDPYHWMQSMCKSPYAAHWKHGPKRCPNLVASDKDKEKWNQIIFDEDELHKKDSTNEDDVGVVPFQVKIIFDSDDVEFFDSLVDVWNEWYRPYWENIVGYPRLIVRFEDMLLHAPIIMEKISSCLGVDRKSQYIYQTSSAKAHGSHTNFLKAIMKTADAEKRKHQLSLKDKIYAAQHLDVEMMEAFQYRRIEE